MGGRGWARVRRGGKEELGKGGTGEGRIVKGVNVRMWKERGRRGNGNGEEIIGRWKMDI